MKLKIYIIALLNLVLLSCSKDFIDLAPISNVNSKIFYKTETDISTALNGVYGLLQKIGLYGDYLATTPEYRGGNCWNSWMQGDFDKECLIEFRENTDNSRILSIWQDSYTCILQCNIFIERVNPFDIDETLKGRYIGEVKFIRALLYFNLVRLFGDVPLVLQELTTIDESYNYAREPASKVYEQIVQDLGDAEQNLPLSYSGADVGRVTKGAAKALLGKVYLTQHEYSLAKNKLKEVIDLNKYALLTEYGYLWDLAHENSVESVFEIQFKKGGTVTGSRYANLFAPKFSAPYTVSVGAPGGDMCPTQDMEDEYEPDDLRKDISMVSGYYGKNGVWVPDKWCIKYVDIPYVGNDADNNWPVLRYADVLLMYAEATNELGYIADGEAFTFLNMVRSRAGLQPKTSSNNDPNLAMPNQEAFREAINHERRVEFAFEGHRFYDLVRWGKLVETMSKFYFGANVKDRNVLFAIPQREIDINPELTQNTGY